MTSPQVALVHCTDNDAIANEIAQELRAYANFKLFHAGGSANGPSLSEQVERFDGPMILLISDNFLRSTPCMHRGLKMLQDHPHQFLPIVIDGEKTDVQTGQLVKVETSFSRINDIIQYINHWQDRYLDLRRQKRELDLPDEDGFNDHLRIVREVSSEAGEFLRLLRSTLHLTYAEFSANDFEQFFIFIDDKNAWESYRRQRAYAQPAPPPSPIPSPEPVHEPTPAPPLDMTFHAQDEPMTSPVETATHTPADREEEPIVNPTENGRHQHNHFDSTPPPPSREEEEEEEPTTAEPALHEEVEASAEPEQATEPEPTSINEDMDEQATVLIRKAWHLADNGQLKTALSILEAGVETYPSRTDLRYHYALMMSQKSEKLDKAREQFEIVLQRDPDHEDALYMLGELADASGEPEHARHYFDRVVAINPDYPDIFYRMGTLTLRHFPDEREEAADYFRRAGKRDPENVDAQYQYALLLADPLDKPRKAIKFLKRVLDLEPDHSFANYDLALLYHQLGDRAAAAEAYHQAVSINPELKTPENDAAFALVESPPATTEPAEAESSAVTSPTEPHFATGEQDPLAALKENIAHLEALLKSRAEAAEVEPEPPAPRPGQGKTVFISGATSGIGRATAQRFAADGYRVIMTGRRNGRLEALREQLTTEHDTDVLALNFDVRDVNAVREAVDGLSDEWRRIDILINNAGKAKGLDYIHEGRLEHWEEMIDTNVKGLLYLTRAISPHMVERGQGHIINVCSTAGHEVYPKGNVYCATKFAVDALTRGMRLDLHQYGIRVSQVSPAHVEETEFALVRFDGDAERAQIYEGFKPLSADDVADAIHYIANQPAHVNILDIVLQGTQQASSTRIDRSGREKYEE